MRDVSVFSRPAELAEFCSEAVFADGDVFADGEVSALVSWVLCHRAPWFARRTAPLERANFSNWLGLVMLRRYENPTVASLYVLHELAHLLTATPPGSGPAGGTEAFRSAVTRSEQVASAVSELWVYRRAPWLRERVFGAAPILFDRLVAADWDRWSLAELVELRYTLVFGDELDDLFFAGTERDDPDAVSLRDWYKGFATTPVWADGFAAQLDAHLPASLETPPSLPYPVSPAAAARIPADPAERLRAHRRATSVNAAVLAAACGVDTTLLPDVADPGFASAVADAFEGTVPFADHAGAGVPAPAVHPLGAP